MRKGTLRILSSFSLLVLLSGAAVTYGKDIEPLKTTRIISSSCPSTPLALPPGARLSEKLFGLPGIGNAGRVSTCIFRGGQPDGEGYRTLSRMGIRTVINLRSRHGEKEAVERAGMRYLEYPIGMLNKIRKEKIAETVRAMVDPANQPVYVHCALGQDRTGIVVAAYRMEVEGWSLADAEREMQSFGFNDAWVHLKKFIREYSEHIGGKTGE